MSEIPSFGGKKFSSRTLYNTILISMRGGIRENGRVYRRVRTRSLTTRIRRSASGTCSLALVQLTRGPFGSTWMRPVMAPPNSPSRQTRMIRNPRLRYRWCCVSLYVFKYSFNLSIGKMCGRGEVNGVADGEEKWNLIHKENVSRKSDLLVEVENFFWDLNKVRNHGRWLRASGFAF